MADAGASYDGSGTGQVSTGELSPDYTRPQSLNAWSYTEQNPINRTDPSGRNWQQPTGLEGTLIHGMISVDFVIWGTSTGRIVAVNVAIQHASKKKNGNVGRADLVDLTSSDVYEIKHRPSWQLAISEATWYQWNLNRDPNYAQLAPWHLGNQYLAQYASAGKIIGPWPADPQHIVRAQLYASGAIVYWGEPQPATQQPQWQPTADYIKYLAYLASLGLAGSGVANWLGGKGGNQPGPVNAAVPGFSLFGFTCPLLLWPNAQTDSLLH